MLLMIMIMQIYIASCENGTFYLLRFTYIPLRPLLHTVSFYMLPFFNVSTITWCQKQKVWSLKQDRPRNRRYKRTHTRQFQETKAKMAAKQSMTQAILQAEVKTSKAATMTIIKTDQPVNNTRPVHATPRSDSLLLKQPKFDSKAAAIIRNCSTLK